MTTKASGRQLENAQRSVSSDTLQPRAIRNLYSWVRGTRRHVFFVGFSKFFHEHFGALPNTRHRARISNWLIFLVVSYSESFTVHERFIRFGCARTVFRCPNNIQPLLVSLLLRCSWKLWNSLKIDFKNEPFARLYFYVLRVIGAKWTTFIHFSWDTIDKSLIINGPFFPALATSLIIVDMAGQRTIF